MDTEVSEDLKIDWDDELPPKNCRVLRKQTSQPKVVCPKEERNASLKKVASILLKSETERSREELQMLKECSEVVEEVQSRWKRRDEAKRRQEEFEDPQELLQEKSLTLAQAIAQSQHLVVYTGAGISTAARIPDYRGTNGIWTRLQQGKDIGNHDLSLAEPTYTHMALAELYHKKILKYVVSQNCDGLHLRSGLPRSALSELHGNMYIEVCKNCKPVKEYLRQFDVTENTARYSHKTSRKCYSCNHPLVDTIVHFGERGNLQWPLNWQGACRNAKNSTTILCLGSSLKVLKKYPWLWQMDKPAKKRPNLYIVNLQWTPKDETANVKVHGKCDEVMAMVMKILGIEVPCYDREKDPIFLHATPLCKEEIHTTSQPFLKSFGTRGDELESEKLGRVKVEIKEEAENEDELMLEGGESRSTSKMVQNKEDCLEESDDSDSLDAIVGPPGLPYCDTSSNIRIDEEKSQNGKIQNGKTQNGEKMLNVEKSSLPVHNRVDTSPQKPSAVHTKFLIDNILDKSTPIKKEKPANIFDLQYEQNALHNNLFFNQAFLTYYQISNALLNSQILKQDLIYYPFQTSFLYPGIHSIINPVPFIKDEYNYANSSNSFETSQMFKSEPIEKPLAIENPACSFCKANNESNVCLFYPPVEARFVKQQYRFSKSDNKSKPVFCVCCDCSSDDDEGEASGKSDSADEKSSDSKIFKLDEASDKEIIRISKIQAGWFGKGYKKSRRNKKR